MMYPLVKELAAGGIPVTVTCRVLKLARQPYYRWLAHPISDSELAEAYLANALFDAHHDDPEFGYRLLADEARAAGHTGCDRTVWRICADNGWWSAFGKKRGRNGKKPGPPAQTEPRFVVGFRGFLDAYTSPSVMAAMGSLSGLGNSSAMEPSDR